MFPSDLNEPLPLGVGSFPADVVGTDGGIDSLLLQFNNSFINNNYSQYNNNNNNFNNIFINNNKNDVDEFTKSIIANISYNSNNHTITTTRGSGGGAPQIRPEMPIWLIPCYSIILLSAIVGNLLVISTLVQNRRMRTITNVFLLNLAISDMLLGVLCMPVTLVGTLLRHFIFGEFLCKLIQFSQATSVAVSSWTLVAISCERYYAICHPLRSRTWQTINHAYRIIGFIWIGSILCMTPIAIFSQLIPTSRQGLRKCREVWPEYAVGYERPYNLLLALFLLVLPLMILSVAYILITRTLYVGMKNERAMIFGCGSKVNTQVEAVATVTTTLMPSTGFNLNMSFRCNTARSNNSNNDSEVYQQENQLQLQQQQQRRQQRQQQHSYDDITQPSKSRKLYTDGRKQFYSMRSASGSYNGAGVNGNSGRNGGCTSTTVGSSPSMTVINVPQQQRFQLHQQRQHQSQQQLDVDRRKSPMTPSLKVTDSALRRSNATKNLESKKRVVKMLFVLVLEFFICWTPLYVINTVGMFVGQAMYEYIDYTSISFFQLLAYSSSCCNPITYCFMNAGFRRAFLDTFKGIHLNGEKFWQKRPKTLNSHSGDGGSPIVMTTSVTLLSNHALDSPRR